LGDLSDQEVHHERSGKQFFIILVSERQVDHGAIVGGEIRSESFLIAGSLLVSIGLGFSKGDRSIPFTVLREGSRSFLARSDRSSELKEKKENTTRLGSRQRFLAARLPSSPAGRPRSLACLGDRLPTPNLAIGSFSPRAWFIVESRKEQSRSDLVGVLHICCLKKKLQSVSVIGESWSKYIWQQAGSNRKKRKQQIGWHHLN
jgi:hypothetical protein